ncbi:hypothetical protein HDU67_006501 [Dinochytrium kinnereticum]|nr:hypothetical protein HDU67_006501 [Dinochytrium kinnereticum]
MATSAVDDGDFDDWLDPITTDEPVPPPVETEDLPSPPPPTPTTTSVYNAVTDCMALKDLYQATGGAQWRNTTGWRSISARPAITAELCNAEPVHGVVFDDAGRVLQISLGLNLLRGSLPPSLGMLDRMTVLNVTSNPNLGGSIPAELFLLPNLNTMVLSNSNFSGSLPSTFQQMVSPLQVLMLG